VGDRAHGPVHVIAGLAWLVWWGLDAVRGMEAGRTAGGWAKLLLAVDPATAGAARAPLDGTSWWWLAVVLVGALVLAVMASRVYALVGPAGRIGRAGPSLGGVGALVRAAVRACW
jgi:hypothetical protein